MMNRLVVTAATTALLFLSGVTSAQTIRINCGSKNDHVDRNGDVWAADTQNFRPADAPKSATWKTKAKIRNTRDDKLYQSERFGRGGNLKYSVPVPESGDYLVRLLFSENYKKAQAIDQRKFHVAIEGRMELANVDIYKQSRKEGYRATSKAVRVVVSGETLDIELIKVKQNPKVNAIEIQKVSSDSTPIEIHPDITAIIDVVGGDVRPLGLPWADSYSIGDRCYCMTTYDHNIDTVQVQTDAGWMTVRQACELIGPGPGYKRGYPLYNTVQCGHGPLNDAGDEHVCPGRVDFGFDGCGHIGPKWRFDEE